jgi:putative membrane protein
MRLLFAFIGFVVLGALWMGPLPDLARTAFSAHMAMHMGVVAVASAFFALSVAGGRYDPARRWPAVFSPVPASFAELIVVWTWHAPALHHFARSSTTGLVLEQGMFLLAGLWLWTAAVGGVDRRGVGFVGGANRGGEDVAVDRDRKSPHPFSHTCRNHGSGPVSRGRRAAGVAGLLLTSMHMTLLGALLALTPRPLYPHLGGAAGWSPLEDQHVGGAIMLLVGGLAYLAGGLWLTAGLLRTDAHRPTRPDHPARPDHAARPDLADGSNADASLQTAEAGRPEGGTV